MTATIHILPGPSVVVKTVEGEARWCFNCCKRVPQTFRLMEDPPERQPSYYEPVWVIRCSGCKASNSVDFPGMPRRWLAPDVWEWCN